MKFNPLKSLSRKNRSLLLIACGGMATTGTLMATAPEHDAARIEERAWPVSATIIEPQTLAPELQLFGRVETANHARLTSAVNAPVRTVGVIEGERVEKGQVLLILDDADEQLRYRQRLADADQAAADLATTERELGNDRQVLTHMAELLALSEARSARLKKLQHQNLVSVEKMQDSRQAVARQAIEYARQQLRVDNHPQRLAAAKAKLSRAQALLEEQELRLSRTFIVAPFTGRISQIDVSPGDRVMEGQALVAIYDTGALRVRAAMPGHSVGSLKRALRSGNSVTARISNGESTVRLQLEQLAGEIKRGRAGVDGLFTISGDSHLLELGRTVDMTIALPAVEQVAAVPVQSIYGDDRIYAIVDERLQAIAVTTVGQRLGRDGELQVLLRAPELLTPTSILTTSLPRASTGLRVQVING